jgi:LuxR family maltose regulon positive regulatory protein
VEEKLHAAEAALQRGEANEKSRYLVGQIATARATLALTRYDVETMLTESRRALEHLHLNNLSSRANANWTLAFAYILQGERAAARRACLEAVALSQASGNVFTTILATVGLGVVQEADNELYQAAETYRHVVQMAGDQPMQIINEAHLGLARIFYEWNDLEAAEQHAKRSLELARQYESVIDRFIISEVFLGRLALARRDVEGAAAILAKASQSARQRNFVHRIPEVAAAQVVTLLRMGEVAAAAELAQTYKLPLGMARVHLSRGEATAALALLDGYRQQAEARGWEDERLKAMVLQAIALYGHGDGDRAVQVLGEAMALAEPGGFIRIFVDEGEPMARLLAEAVAQGMMPVYAGKLLAAFEAERRKRKEKPDADASQPLVEPLSQRELEVLQLIAQGLSNHEISERLFLALDTVKGHNRKIFDKLQVQRRTEAIARGRELGLL